MNNRVLSLLIVFAVLLSSITANGATSKELKYAQLQELGFENLKICQEGNTTYLTAEDNVYRGNYRGIAALLQAISPDEADAEASDTIYLVMLEHQMPRVTVTAIHHNAAQWEVSAEYGADARVMKKVRREHNANSSLGKVDFVIHPQVMLDSLFHDDRYRYAVNVAPAIEMSLWKGAKLTAQIIVPLLNNIDSDKTFDKIRPGIMTLSQNVVLNKWFEMTATAGIFHTNQSIYADCRQGLDLNLTSHLTSQIDFGVNVGYTGKFYLDDSAWKFETPDRLSILGNVGYYSPSFNSQVNLYFGQFVYGDKGARLDFTRRLAEYAVGFFGTYAEKEKGLGFYCSIPVGPKKRMKHNAVRISLPESMNWDYSMPNYSKKFSKDRLGVTYNTTTEGKYSNNYWQPRYIAKYVKKVLSGKLE